MIEIVLNRKFLWDWTANHSFELLLAIYFLTTVCVGILTLHVKSLGKKMRTLTLAAERQAQVLSKLVQMIDPARLRAADTEIRSGEDNAKNNQNPTEVAAIDTAKMRTEIEAVLAEMWSENSTEVPNTLPAD